MRPSFYSLRPAFACSQVAGQVNPRLAGCGDVRRSHSFISASCIFFVRISPDAVFYSSPTFFPKIWLASFRLSSKETQPVLTFYGKAHHKRYRFSPQFPSSAVTLSACPQVQVQLKLARVLVQKKQRLYPPKKHLKGQIISTTSPMVQFPTPSLMNRTLGARDRVPSRAAMTTDQIAIANARCVYSNTTTMIHQITKDSKRDSVGPF